MTIALAVTVNEGAVIGADSAVSITAPDGSFFNTYGNACKVFQLHDKYPIAAATYGAAFIGVESLASLCHQLRNELNASLPSDYKMTDVADIAKAFMLDGKYSDVWKTAAPENRANVGMMLVGYSSSTLLPEIFAVETKGGIPQSPHLIAEQGMTCVCPKGEPETITRLTTGMSACIPEALQAVLSVDDRESERLMRELRAQLNLPLINGAMPLGEAVELSRFLLDTTVTFARFAPGPKTIIGPVDIATVSREQGFTWVQRKG